MTSAASRYVPVSHLQGDSKTIRVDFLRTVDDVIVPRDMTAYEFTAQIRNRPGASDKAAELEVDDTNAGDGIVLFVLGPPASDALTVAERHWDAQWVLGGRPFTFAIGPWSTEGQVTR